MRKRWLNSSFPGHVFKLVLIMLFILSSSNLFYATETWFGAHGGLSLPNLKGGDNPLSQGYTSRKAPFLGLTLIQPLSTHLNLRAEINYSSQGGKRDGMQPIDPSQVPLPLPPDVPLYANFHNETIIDYVEVPLMLQIDTGERPGLFFAVGGYAGYRVRAKTVTSGSSLIYLDEAGTQPVSPEPVSFEANTDVSQEINRWNFGLCGAAGLSWKLGTGQAVLGARFNYGLSNIQSHPEIAGRNRTGGFMIILGYLINIAR
jgi:hypothetical protein